MDIQEIAMTAHSIAKIQGLEATGDIAWLMPVLLFLAPISVSFLTELVKVWYKGELTGQAKQSIQFVSSLLIGGVIFVGTYIPDTTAWEMVLRVVMFAFTLAKLSTFFYKGFPLIEMVPYVGEFINNFNLHNGFKKYYTWVQERENKKELDALHDLG